MKEKAQLLLRDIKSMLTRRSVQFLVLAIGVLLVVEAANASYDFGKEIGASVYFLTH
jgi:hypothetical protein